MIKRFKKYLLTKSNTRRMHTKTSSGIPRNNRKSFSIRRVLARNTDEFCKSTTLHGFKYVANEELHPSERSFFAISICIVIIISSVFILKVYHKWATTPVIFSINPEPTFIRNEPFPAVTVCNLNQALRSKAMEFSKSSVEYAMLQLLCKKKANATIADSITDWSSLESFIVNISQPCEDMVIGCRFGATETDCAKFFLPIVTDEGLCCVFNMIHPIFMFVLHTPFTLRNVKGGLFKPVDWYAEQGYPSNLPEKFYPRTAAGTGESLGLSIVLNVEKDKYYCSSSNCVGFKVSLHSPNESPNVRETGVLISPGKESKVRIRPEKIETNQHLRTIHTRYRQCVFHDERKLLYFAHYTQRNCEMECIAKTSIQHCGCISFYMPKLFGNETICSIALAYCIEKVRLRLDPTLGSCLDECLPSCFDLTFMADVFAAPIAHEGFDIENPLVQNFSSKFVEKNIAVVNIYFKEYSYRGSLQTEFVGISDFLSSVGGLMGLFLGFSFLSLVELIYFAIMRPFRMIWKQERPKSMDVVLVMARKKARKLNEPRSNSTSNMSMVRRKRFSKQFSQSNGIYESSGKYLYGKQLKAAAETLIDKDLLYSISKSLEDKNAIRMDNNF